MLKERMGDFMGGQIIRTRTDDIIEQGREQGIMEAKRAMTIRMADLGILIPVIALSVDLPEKTVKEILDKKQTAV